MGLDRLLVAVRVYLEVGALDGQVVVTIQATDPANPAANLGTVAVTIPYQGGVHGDGWTEIYSGGYSGQEARP